MTVGKTISLSKGAQGLLHNPRFLVLRSGKVFDVQIMIVHPSELNGEFEGQPIDSWKDNRRFRCVVIRSIDWNMVVSPYNNNYPITHNVNNGK